MKINKIVIYFLLVLSGTFCCHQAISQKQEAEISKSVNIKENNTAKEILIGERVPGSIWNKIPRKKTTELVILDFWSTGCVSCLEAFPRMEKLQKEFDKKLQIVLINPWETKQKVENRMQILNKNRTADNMEPFKVLKSLPTIDGEKVYMKLFPLNTVPQHVWIDRNGKVLYITYGYNATEKHVQDVLNGEKIKMSLKRDLTIDKFNAWDGILKKGHQSIKPAFYSGFTRYNSGFGSGNGFKRNTIDSTYLRVFLNSTIINLYKTAFGHGKRMILDLKNLSDYYEPDRDNAGDAVDDWCKNNLFSYEICVPANEEKNISYFMQEDLNRFFGIEKGIKGELELKKLKCLLLVKLKDGLLTTSGGETKIISKKEFIQWINQPFEYIVNGLANLEDMNEGRPFLNETNIDLGLRADIQLAGDLTNIAHIKKQLNEYGLDLVEGEREVEILVVKEK